EGFGGKKLGPVKHFGTPYVCIVQNLQPVLGCLLLQACGNQFLDLVSPTEAFRGIGDGFEFRQVKQGTERRQMRHRKCQVSVRRIVNTVWCGQVSMSVSKSAAPGRPMTIVHVRCEHLELKIEKSLNQAG